MFACHFSSKTRGFSFPELLLVVSIIGVISALSYPIVRNFASANTYAEAQAKAEALTVAKILFYRTDPLASEKWSSAANEEAQFALVQDFLYQAEASLTLADYLPPVPFNEMELGEDIRDPVLVPGEEEGEDAPEEENVSPQDDGEGQGNNGHGNNEDGVDVSNPGNGHGGPNGQEDPSGDVDDEIHDNGNPWSYLDEENGN